MKAELRVKKKTMGEGVRGEGSEKTACNQPLEIFEMPIPVF